MFISDRLVFVELHKTGCTHIGVLLQQLFPQGRTVGKHNPATADLFDGRRVFLGSVRNPWDWYLSLWAYGCDGSGSVYESLTRRGVGVRGLGWREGSLRAAGRWLGQWARGTGRWRRVYRDVEDAGAFRDWLWMMHDARHADLLREAYGQSSVSRVAGLMTHRFVKLYCRECELLDRAPALDAAGLRHWAHRHGYIDAWVRTERLEADLIEALEVLGLGLDERGRGVVLGGGRTNGSSRKRPASAYYDDATVALVGERERLIVSGFGYRFGEVVSEAMPVGAGAVAVGGCRRRVA